MIGGSSSLQNELYALLKELENKNESNPFSTSSPSNFSTSVSANSEDVTHSSVTTDTVMDESLPSVDADDAIEAVIKSQSTSNDNEHLDEITQDLHGGANIVEMVENIFAGGNRGGNKGSKPQSRKCDKRVTRNHRYDRRHNHDASTTTSKDEPHSKDYSGQEIIDQIFNGNKNTRNDVCEACGETDTNLTNSHHTRGGNANILDSSDSESSEKKNIMSDLGMNSDMFNVTYSNKNDSSSDGASEDSSDKSSDSSSDASTDSDDMESIKRIRREMNHQMKAYEGDEEGNSYASPSKLDLGFNPSSDSDNDGDDGDDGSNNGDDGSNDGGNDDGNDVSANDSDVGDGDGDGDGNGNTPNVPNSDTLNTPNSDASDTSNGQLNSDSDSDAVNDFIPRDESNIGLHPDIIDSKINKYLPDDLNLEDSDNEFDGTVGLDPSYPDDYIVKEHNNTSSDFNDHSDFIKIIHEMRANDNNIVLNGGNVKVAKRIKMMNMYPWILKSSSRY